MEELASMPGEAEPSVARMVLGATLYLEDCLSWSCGGVVNALDAFCRLAPVDRVAWWTTSQIDEWHAVTADGIGSLRESLGARGLLHGRPRHLFRFELVDDAGAPSVGFSYREIDSRRSSRAGVLELTVPLDWSPEALHELVSVVGAAGPWTVGLAGHAVRWSFLHRRAAFDQAYRWCRRFRGLHVDDAEDVAWHVERGLPGASWLTLISRRAAQSWGLDLDRLAAHPFRNDVTLETLPSGVVVRAGGRPSAGDTNALEYPWAQAEVTRWLAPWILRDLPEHWGLFGSRRETTAWRLRLVEPKGWK